MPISAQQEQKKAIAGNYAALPEAQKLATATNTFNQNEISRMLELAMPGYTKLRDKTTSNIMDWSSGKLPQDVSDAVARNAATRALYGGYGGTGMGRNLTARDLGLTSLDLMTKGFDAATRWIGMSKAPNFDVSSMFISPQFQTQFAQQERDAKFQHDYIKNQWDWYGSFGQQATRFEDTIAQLAASAAGAMAACWVAREVFGKENPKWLQFRHWLFNFAPDWFRNLYLKHGEKFAAWISDKPILKRIIRVWMESRIDSMKGGLAYV